jgi:hypothetical protein
MTSNDKHSFSSATADIMVDIETLGTVPGSIILAIGAAIVRDTPDTVGKSKYFYATISRGNQEDLGFTVNPNTVLWWERQEPAARLEVFSGLSDISIALKRFADFVYQFEHPRLWGNSAAFDLGLLSAAYEIMGQHTPWSYWQEMCYRTFKSVYRTIPVPKLATIPHKAIDDAVAQAAHLALILNVVDSAIIGEK